MADYAVRLSHYGLRIEAYRNLGKAWGFVTLIADEIEESHTDRKFLMQFSLPPEVATEIISLAENTGITKIPSQNQIEGWEQGFDGTTYIIEIKTEGQYSFKTYWSPDAQDISEAIKVDKFISQVMQISAPNSLYKTFTNQVPFKSFRINGPIFSRLFIDETFEQFEERQKYIRERQTIFRQNQTKN